MIGKLLTGSFSFLALLGGGFLLPANAQTATGEAQVCEDTKLYRRWYDETKDHIYTIPKTSIVWVKPLRKNGMTSVIYRGKDGYVGGWVLSGKVLVVGTC